jgi:anti-sigma-K factor RskA
MDLQSFIQSGLLEAYVLGQCTADERAQVERMAAQYPEVKAEINAIEASLEAYATAHAVPPPGWMKDRILERIDQENTSPAAQPGKKRSTALLLFQALAFLLAAASSFLFLRQKEVEAENERLHLTNDSLQQQLAACTDRLQNTSPIAELLCDPGTKRILVSDGKGIHSWVYYNPRNGQMAYDPSSLPEMPDGKFCQFWAIVDGKPVSMGMVKDAKSLCETMRSVPNAQAFAFSEEPNAEGNPSPTVVLAAGKV